MVDISRFIRLREYAEVIQENGEWYLTFKRFSPETGEELEPERQAISAEGLNERRAKLETELAAIKAILKEIE
jgi:hypothetical protein